MRSKAKNSKKVCIIVEEPILKSVIKGDSLNVNGPTKNLQLYFERLSHIHLIFWYSFQSQDILISRGGGIK